MIGPDDIIIDGVNSFDRDDIRRAKTLAEKRIRYIDCGTSGGGASRRAVHGRFTLDSARGRTTVSETRCFRRCGSALAVTSRVASPVIPNRSPTKRPVEPRRSCGLAAPAVASIPQYIPPPIPPADRDRAEASVSLSGSGEMTASVVSRSEAIDAAFCNAERTTLAGSMTPAFTRFS